MRAAVVHAYGATPGVEDVAEPSPRPGELVVEVLAAAIHPRTRSQAAGTHYTDRLPLPLVPGIDGVGRDAAGRLRYFLLPDTPSGSMAERTAIDPRRSVELPAGIDPVLVAAAMNPLMSSWVALRRRVRLRRGQRVMILGATGSAGRLAVQVARRLGAGVVIAAGRGAARMADLGADRLVDLEAPDAAAELAEAGAEVDIVLDYLWGPPTAEALRAIVPARRRDGQPLDWIEIGSVAGLEAPIPSAALRATNLRLLGSGQGSVAPQAIRAEVARIAKELGRGTFRVASRTVPLDEIGAAWAAPGGERLVVIP